MRRTNTWHFLQQSGQFLRLSGQARSEAEGGPTASKIDHFVEGNATCWSDACENAGEKIDFASRFPPRRLGAKKESKLRPREIDIRVRSVRFTPRGLEKKVKGIFVIFQSVVTWAWWLVFDGLGCGGWFLLNEDALASF